MAYPLDQEKWRRVREMLDRQDLDAIVVRAPDNVLYLTNYWTMKGYDLAIFPREGEPTLLIIEPQFREAQRTAWNKDVRFFPFYHPKDPRPPMIRALEMAVEVLKERNLTRRVGIELSQNSQICDRMVGEPTVYWQGFYDSFRAACKETVDAAPLLAQLRMIKTPQEIERMRLANELAALGMEHARDNIQPGMKESEVAAMIEGHIHHVGIGYKGKVEMARAFTLVWSGPTMPSLPCATALPWLISTASFAEESTPPVIPGNPRIPSDTAWAPAHMSRHTRIRQHPERCSPAWSGPSNPAFTGKVAGACVWKTISW